MLFLFLLLLLFLFLLLLFLFLFLLLLFLLLLLLFVVVVVVGVETCNKCAREQKMCIEKKKCAKAKNRKNVPISQNEVHKGPANGSKVLSSVAHCGIELPCMAVQCVVLYGLSGFV